MHQLHTLLAMKPSASYDSKFVSEKFKDTLASASKLRANAETLVKNKPGDTSQSASVRATAALNAVRAFITISCMYLRATPPGGRVYKLSFIEILTNRLLASTSDTPTKKFVQTVQKDIKQYTAISLPTKGKREPDFDSDNFGMIEEALNGIDILSTVSGQMTGGKGNEGFAETAKLAPAEGDPDKRNQGAKNVAKTFKKFEPKDPKGQDQLSGYSDAANAALGLGGDSLTLWKLWTKYKDPATSKSEKHQIRLEISVFGFSAVANILT